MYKLSETELQEIHKGLLELLKAFKEVCEKEGIWYTLAFGTVLGAIRHKGFIPWDSDADVCIKLADMDRFREAFAKYKPKGIALKNHDIDRRNTKSHDILYFEKEQCFSDLHLDVYPLVGAPNNKEKQVKIWKRNYFLDRFFRSKYVNLADCLEENRKKVFLVKLIDKFIPDSFIKANIHKREREFNVDETDYWTCLAAPYKPVPKQSWSSVILMPFEDTEFNVPGEWDLYLTSLYGDYMTPRKY